MEEIEWKERKVRDLSQGQSEQLLRLASDRGEGKEYSFRDWAYLLTVPNYY